MAARTVLGAGATALQVAGNFSGVPYASAVGTLVAGIVTTTEQVAVHKVSYPQLKTDVIIYGFHSTRGNVNDYRTKQMH